MSSLEAAPLDAVDDRESIRLGRRAVIVAAASASDMVVNFPLWIVAKRVSAGLPLPPRGELYKGSGTLYLAMGPMTVVADGSTTLFERALLDLGGFSQRAALACASMASGVAGALLVGAQVEALVTRAHALGGTVAQAAGDTLRSGGLRGLLLPHGLTMIAAREVPYCGCLFFLSGQFRARLRPSAQEPPHSWLRLAASDYAAAFFTALVAGPLSHAPSVVASYQQAHAAGLGCAVRAIYEARGGLRGFFHGLLPRTLSLSGSLFIVPFTIELLQPLLG